MSTTEIVLTYPLEVSGGSVRSLHMRRPTVADMIAADKSKGSDAEKEVAMFANLCTVAPADLLKLDMADYQKLREVWTGFLSSDQPKLD